MGYISLRPHHHCGQSVRYDFSVTDSTRELKVLVYSDDSNVRTSVRVSLGRRPSADISNVDILECATEPAVIAAMDKGAFDVVILDGEAVPAGGMGLCRQLKDEIFQCPPVIVLVGRADDRWLATWSLADAVVAHPIDPRALVQAFLNLVSSSSTSV